MFSQHTTWTHRSDPLPQRQAVWHWRAAGRNLSARCTQAFCPHRKHLTLFQSQGLYLLNVEIFQRNAAVFVSKRKLHASTLHNVVITTITKFNQSLWKLHDLAILSNHHFFYANLTNHLSFTVHNSPLHKTAHHHLHFLGCSCGEADIHDMHFTTSWWSINKVMKHHRTWWAAQKQQPKQITMTEDAVSVYCN